MHVRSFTQHQSSGARHKGTFAGAAEKIPYLKELGVNCVELMPIFEFDEFENSRESNGKKLYNYWGYSTVDFFAPKAGYAASAPFGMDAGELKSMIRRLHSNGIAVILDVVFNHTAEGNEYGPSISYKGIDNSTYYLLTPDGYYYNFSGCGNTMNCNNHVVRNVVLDALRYWVSSYHVDGFRFDLASILSRDEDGAPMLDPPLLDSIANDAVLGKCMLIAEAWDAGGLYQVAPGLTFAYMYAEDSRKFGTKRDSFIYIAVNSHWEEHRFELPVVPEKFVWRLAFEAYGLSSAPGNEKKVKDQSGITVGARSTAVLIAERR